MKRLASAVPLLAAYLSLSALYAWQAWQRQTVTLFSDEIEFTQMSRAVADTGSAALRGGSPALETSVYAYLAAPAWWLGEVSDAYGAVKLLGVLLMTAAIFPAYGLARLVVSRPAAMLAAVATAAAPALSYSPFLVDEPLAYPVSTLALFLIARAAVAPTPPAAALALLSCVAGYYVRPQLAILFPVALGVVLARVWDLERARRWRSRWTAGDWIGAAVLLLGVAVTLSAVLGKRSYTWYVTTGFIKGRIFEYGLWAAGAFAIGIGVLPLVAALAALVRPRNLPPDPRRRAFAALSFSALAVFGTYTAIKAAFLSTTLAIIVAERNLIYLYPVVFAATALLLERRRVSAAALAAATAFALYLVTSTPLSLGSYPNYEAHGLSIAAFANRILRWPEPKIETALVLVTIASGVLLFLLSRARANAASSALVGAVAAVVLAWSLTTEIYAANGERLASDAAYANLPKPPDWVARTTRDRPTVFVGQGIDGPAAWQVEFWNPNIRWFWGIDGSAPGPGARTTPDLARTDGTLRPTDLGAEYALAVNGVQIAAPEVTTVGGAVLHDLRRGPVRLAQTTSGISPDGWMVREATFTRYRVDDVPRGVIVRFSRQGACGAPAVRVRARVGPVAVGPNNQPTLESVTDEGVALLPQCKVTGIFLRVPSRPWRVEAEVAETFVPHDLDERSGDRRELGAVVGFEPVGS